PPDWRLGLGGNAGQEFRRHHALSRRVMRRALFVGGGGGGGGGATGARGPPPPPRPPPPPPPPPPTPAPPPAPRPAPPLARRAPGLRLPYHFVQAAGQIWGRRSGVVPAGVDPIPFALERVAWERHTLALVGLVEGGPVDLDPMDIERPQPAEQLLPVIALAPE